MAADVTTGFVTVVFWQRAESGPPSEGVWNRLYDLRWKDADGITETGFDPEENKSCR